MKPNAAWILYCFPGKHLICPAVEGRAHAGLRSPYLKLIQGSHGVSRLHDSGAHHKTRGVLLYGDHILELLCYGAVVVHEADATKLQRRQSRINITSSPERRLEGCEQDAAAELVKEARVLTTAIAAAISASVTVSMGELTIGMFRGTLRLTRVDRST